MEVSEGPVMALIPLSSKQCRNAGIDPDRRSDALPWLDIQQWVLRVQTEGSVTDRRTVERLILLSPMVDADRVVSAVKHLGRFGGSVELLVHARVFQECVHNTLMSVGCAYLSPHWLVMVRAACDFLITACDNTEPMLELPTIGSMEAVRAAARKALEEYEKATQRHAYAETGDVIETTGGMQGLEPTFQVAVDELTGMVEESILRQIQDAIKDAFSRELEGVMERLKEVEYLCLSNTGNLLNHD